MKNDRVFLFRVGLQGPGKVVARQDTRASGRSV